MGRVTTLERCQITELLIEQCAHCRPAPAPDPFDTPTNLGPWFKASFGGYCGGCGEPYGAGERIRADLCCDGYLCEGCGADDH
jgi:hypothetical protein